MLIQSHKHTKDFCLATRDSLNMSFSQAIPFSLLIVLIYSAFAWQCVQGMWIYATGMILLFAVTRNPFKVEAEYYMATVKDIHFSWAINLLFFRLFCINGRFFVPNQKISNIVSIRLKEYRRLQRD